MAMHAMMPAAAGPAEAPPALAVRGVSHRFGAAVALDNVSLSVPSGRLTILLGLNGAGKSTLFALVTRLFDNVSGEIRILGHDVRRAPSAALRRLGVVFQNRTLDQDLSVRENLVYHAALHGIAGADRDRRIAALLAMAGMAERARDRVRALSGGQARRVEIARALLHEPQLLLLDEASVGLDIGAREAVLRLVRSLAATGRLGVLWATHLIDEVEPEDRIVVLHRGRVLFEGEYPEFLARTGAGTVRAGFAALTAERAEAGV